MVPGPVFQSQLLHGQYNNVYVSLMFVVKQGLLDDQQRCIDSQEKLIQRLTKSNQEKDRQLQDVIATTQESEVNKNK